MKKFSKSRTEMVPRCGHPCSILYSIPFFFFDFANFFYCSLAVLAIIDYYSYRLVNTISNNIDIIVW